LFAELIRTSLPVRITAGSKARKILKRMYLKSRPVTRTVPVRDAGAMDRPAVIDLELALGIGSGSIRAGMKSELLARGCEDG
jgi:hypothetical protein